MSRGRAAIGGLALLAAAVVLGVVLIAGETSAPRRSPRAEFRITQANWRVVQLNGARELPAGGDLRYCAGDHIEYVEPRLAWSRAPLGERYGFATAGSVRFRHLPDGELLRFLRSSGSFAPAIGIPWSPGSPPARGTLSFSMRIASRTVAAISLGITPRAGC